MCKGCTESAIDQVKWPDTIALTVLGHSHDRLAAKTSRRAACWVNCVRLLKTCVASRFVWKLARWPMQKTIAINLNAIQCKMCVGLLNCVRLHSESFDIYERRRKRELRKYCSSQGFWSNLTATRVISLQGHIIRTPTTFRSFSDITTRTG